MSVPIAQITAVQLSHQLAGNQRPLLLDCREPDEWRLCRIQGARHIPMNQIGQHYGP
jgi:rhodanese-related sulfurtransferase